MPALKCRPRPGSLQISYRANQHPRGPFRGNAVCEWREDVQKMYKFCPRLNPEPSSNVARSPPEPASEPAGREYVRTHPAPADLQPGHHGPTEYALRRLPPHGSTGMINRVVRAAGLLRPGCRFRAAAPRNGSQPLMSKFLHDRKDCDGQAPGPLGAGEPSGGEKIRQFHRGFPAKDAPREPRHVHPRPGRPARVPEDSPDAGTFRACPARRFPLNDGPATSPAGPSPRQAREPHRGKPPVASPTRTPGLYSKPVSTAPLPASGSESALAVAGKKTKLGGLIKGGVR